MIYLSFINAFLVGLKDMRLLSAILYFQSTLLSIATTGNMCGLFSKKEKIEPKYLIALIGMTGAGKSTFISKATGRKDIEISNSSSSCAYLFSCLAIS